jgi:hypothetical protein
MEFNNYWTKDINDLYHNMVKEGKSINEIRNHFDNNVLMHHPNKKFHVDIKIPSLLKYNIFLNEIKIIPSETKYTIDYKNSEMYNDVKDYFLSFNVNGVNYIIVLFYYIVNNVSSFNILFTTQKQYNEYLEIKGNKKYSDITIDEFNQLSIILEEETNYNNIIKIMKSISFILKNFHNILKYYNDIPYSICEINNPIKIKLYGNIIKNSFDDIIETKDIMKNSKNIYYYQIKNK